MESRTETIRSQALSLGLSNTRNRLDPLLHTAEQKGMTHLEFLEHLLGEEIRCRLDKARDRRIREACFPYEKPPDFASRTTKKAANLFQTYSLCAAVRGGGYSVFYWS